MKQVQIHTSSPYCVTIGSGVLSQVGVAAASLSGVVRAAVISDSNVWPLYGQAVLDQLSESGLETSSFVFPAGESSKNGENYLKILNFLAEHHLTRTDLIIALGGGVTGDLAGFAAATYLRGIRFLQIPTTLLAAVDSSVGGKTAIDLPAGKNLAGAFHQPSAVLCDTDCLRTLPESVFLDGCAEVIKYGILYDPELFRHLETCGPDFDREYVITRCVELKNAVVSEDEFDRGSRQKLNLGHTVGHGVEKCSHFTVSHGRAVAIGTAIVTRSAEAMGLCDKETRERILSVLEKFCLPRETEFSARQLAEVAMSDKKCTGHAINMILPREIGRCDIVPTPVEQLPKFIETGL